MSLQTARSTHAIVFIILTRLDGTGNARKSLFNRSRCIAEAWRYRLVMGHYWFLPAKLLMVLLWWWVMRSEAGTRLTNA